MNVLSLFDGISCGRVALERAGIRVDNYFASEIDKYAIKIAQKNYPVTIQLGDINDWESWDLPPIDLVMGGSPCQGFSVAGKRMNFDDPRSQLYFRFLEILEHYSPKYFLLENVKMNRDCLNIITESIGVEPIHINSRLVSAQNRPRWYWTNLDVEQPEDRGIYLKDILEPEVDEKYYIKAGRLKWLKEFGEVKEKQGYVAFNPDKAKCLTVRAEPSWNTTYLVQWPHGTNKGGFRAVDGKTPSVTTSSWESNNYLLEEGYVRKLTPVECERLQTLPDGFTEGVSNSQRYKAIGNGWTVDVIAHIFGGIKP